MTWLRDCRPGISGECGFGVAVPDKGNTRGTAFLSVMLVCITTGESSCHDVDEHVDNRMQDVVCTQCPVAVAEATM